MQSYAFIRYRYDNPDYNPDAATPAAIAARVAQNVINGEYSSVAELLAEEGMSLEEYEIDVVTSQLTGSQYLYINGLPVSAVLDEFIP